MKEFFAKCQFRLQKSDFVKSIGKTLIWRAHGCPILKPGFLVKSAQLQVQKLGDTHTTPNQRHENSTAQMPFMYSCPDTGYRQSSTAIENLSLDLNANSIATIPGKLGHVAQGI